MTNQFDSTVLFVNDFPKMKHFYTEILDLNIVNDFGTCIALEGGLSLWKIQSDYPIAQKIEYTYHRNGNKNLEICLTTNHLDDAFTCIKTSGQHFVHEIEEEPWGQRTFRFYDPEDNLIEIGETLECFVGRFYKQGLTIEEVSQRTSVPVEMVKMLIKK